LVNILAAMKQLRMILILVAGTIVLANCGSPEPPPPPPMNPVENVIHKGIHEGLEELNEQMTDTSAMFHDALDTMQDVYKDNQKEINAGLNVLKKIL